MSISLLPLTPLKQLIGIMLYIHVKNNLNRFRFTISQNDSSTAIERGGSVISPEISANVSVPARFESTT